MDKAINMLVICFLLCHASEVISQDSLVIADDKLVIHDIKIKGNDVTHESVILREFLPSGIQFQKWSSFLPCKGAGKTC